MIPLRSVSVDETFLMFAISVLSAEFSLESFDLVSRAFLREVSKRLFLSNIAPFKLTVPVNERMSLTFEGALRESCMLCLTAKSLTLSMERKSQTTELLRSKGLRVTSLMKKE